MTSTFALRFRRPIVTLLCAQLLLTASGATELPPVGQRDAQRPPPSSVIPAPVPQATRTMPNFEAPSATHCARPIQTVETPGVVDARTELTITADDSSAGRYFGARSESSELRKPMPSGASSEAKVDAAPAAAMAGPAPATPAPTAAAAPMPVAPTVQAVPAAPGISPPPPTRRAAPSTAAVATPSGRLAVGTPPPQSIAPARPAYEPVTAGMVDDNADFREYLDFRKRTMVPHRERDISQRYLLQVRDARGTVVPDAEVAVQAANGAAMWARTDAGGRAWLHPNAFDASTSPVYEVTVRKGGRQATAFLRRDQKNAVDVTLPATGAVPARARLDLVFLIDATGSMDDEIAKLKTTLHSIADEVAKLPSRPDTCFGLVAYRDRGDQFLVRRHDFTNDLRAFQGVLDALQAGGGGDYPEAMNEALNMTVHKLSWRGDGATRLVVLLADAPPHLDYGAPQYDEDMVAALGKGIKVFSVGASGLDKQGEYIQRQIAQYTGGRFVFLTYNQASNPASGPGTKTVHDVGNYSVQTLDRLIVRLVSEELGKLPTADRRGG